MGAVQTADEGVDTAEARTPADDAGDVQTIEEARTVIRQLRDRCRFQAHQALLWRKKAKTQVRPNGRRR